MKRKRMVALIMTAVFISSVIPYAFAENEELMTETYGEYRQERIGTLGDKDSRGLLFFPEREMMYDFDQAEMPEGIVPSKSTVELSNKYYTTPCQEEINNSLKWNTEGVGSKLNLKSGVTIELPKDDNGNNLYDWRHSYHLIINMFQEKATEDRSKRSFDITLLGEEGEVERFSIYLHREGWNFFAKQLSMIPDKTKISSIQIQQTDGAGGDIYIDDVMIYIHNGMGMVAAPYIELRQEPSEKAKDYPVNPLSDDEKAAFKTIEERVVPPLDPVEKLDDDKMQAFREYYQSWNIQETGGGFVNSENPSYYHRASPGYTVPHDDSYFMLGRCGGLTSQYRVLAEAYNKVCDTEQKEELKGYLIGLTRMALTYGNVPDTWYAGQGFAEGVYYAKQALEEAGLATKMAEQLKAQYKTDALLYAEHEMEKPPLNPGNHDLTNGWKRSADDLHTAAVATMLSVLVEEDSPAKARDLYRLKSFLDNILLNYAPATDGTLKPDGSMFHHLMQKYDYGWTQGWNGATRYVDWLRDTPFSVSQETLERLNNIADVRYKILGLDGSAGTDDQRYSQLSSEGTLRLAKMGTSDGSVKVNPYRASEWLSWSRGSGSNSEFREKCLTMGIKPEVEPQSNYTMSYAGLNVHRRSGWKLQTYASSKDIVHNEYSRPATLFYNLAGMSLTTNDNNHPAMLINPNDNIGGRGDFNPASGYNFNRAPGVTAPDVDAKKVSSPANQKGSSDFVGGVSTRSGNGVFTSVFDAKENSKMYMDTVASDFQFKKSYFYFDDTIVCLASDIGYGGNETVTTGLYQEKAGNEDNIVLSDNAILGAETYNNSYDSTQTPWFFDKLHNIGFYIFPNQRYTMNRGTQTFLFKDADASFDGKGNYASAYITQDAKEVKENNGKYAYILKPNASEEKMKDMNNSMESENPEIEIVRQDNKAHIVRNNRINSVGYVFYDCNTELEEETVTKVSSPVTILTKEMDEGSILSLAVADPALRIDKIEGNEFGWSLPKEISITLKGGWKVKDTAQYEGRENSPVNIAITETGDSVITVNCKDGLTNEYLFESVDNPLETEPIHTFTFHPDSNIAMVDQNELRLNKSIKNVDGVLFAAIYDIAKLLGSEAEWVSTESRAKFDWKDKRITITLGSKIATIDNKIVILEKQVMEEDGRYFVPLHFLGDILNDTMRTDEQNKTVSYSIDDAEWRTWDKVPSYIAPHLSNLMVDNAEISYDKDVTSYIVEIEDNRRTCPEISFEADECYDVQIEYPEMMPGRAIITVFDKNGKLSSNQYTISFRYPTSNYVITASDTPQPENSPPNSMDGDINTYWGSPIDGCWIQYDVGEEVEFQALGIAYKAGDRRTAKFEIEVSSDGENWLNVYQGETSGKTLQIERYDFAPIKGRYIRIIGHGASNTGWNSITEVVVYKQ